MKNEYIFIKQEDEYCNTIEQFKNIFSSNKRIIFEEKNLIVDGKKLSYTIKETIVKASKEILFHLVINSTAEKEIEQVEAINCADDAFRKTNKEYGLFLINTIWDETSMYYGKSLYPQIVEIENKLRKIIYIFMLKNIGSKWLETNTPDKAKQSIEATIEKNNLAGEIKVDWLSYADFITLGIFFSAKYALKNSIEELISELRKLDKLSEEKIKSITDNYIQKSNWERYFADKTKVKGNWSKKWNSLYDIRNKVAHSKAISKEDYEKAIGLIKELEKVFEECFKHIDEVKMTDIQSEAIENVAQKTIVSKRPSASTTFDTSIVTKVPDYIWGTPFRMDDPIINAGRLSIEKMYKDGVLNVPVSDMTIVNKDTAFLLNSAYDDNIYGSGSGFIYPNVDDPSIDAFRFSKSDWPLSASSGIDIDNNKEKGGEE